MEAKRRVLKDATFTHEGKVYEVSGRHLAGKTITIVADGLTGRLLRVSYQDRPIRFGVCDPIDNQRRRRPKTPDQTTQSASTVPFDPIAALLQEAREIDHE